jgi:hypothetical protein
MPHRIRPLYTSGEVRAAITRLFSDPKGRRVALVAFVGEGAGAFLPHPDGIELVCWPQPGGTNPSAIRNLIAAGVEVRFADRLHMKIYWAAGKGVIVTSANLSINALGSGDLREVGVLLPASTIKIDRIISTARPRPVTEAELNRLEKAHKRFHTGRTRPPDRSRAVSFREWHDLPYRPKWKLGFWVREYDISNKAQHLSMDRYGVRHPNGALECDPHKYSVDDWILCIRTRGNSVTRLEWMYTDFVLKFQSAKRAAKGGRSPCEAVQVRTAKHYPAPPFALSPDLKSAFDTVLKAPRLIGLTDSKVTQPSATLIRSIYAELNS